MAKDRAYMRAYMARRYAARRERAVQLLGGKCSKCEETQNLEVDHIDPRSRTRSSCRWAYLSEVRFLDEMKKCQLLCRQHHALKSIEERGHVPAKGRHGTLSSYRYCKCGPCRKAKSDSNRDYKLRQKTDP